MLAAELISELAALDGLQAEWDALTTAAATPLMSPSWILPWWRHLASADAQPRVVAVRDGPKLIGLAPFYVASRRRSARIDYRLPGIELAVRLSPLAISGREWEVAGMVARALHQATPRPDLIALEGGPVAAPWLAGMRHSWPGPLAPYARLYNLQACPVVSMRAGSYDEWLEGRSAKFRTSMRRLSRRFEERSGSQRLSTQETLADDIATLIGLHRQRWERRGTSSLLRLGQGLPAMLAEAGRLLLDQGRFRLWVAEVEGEPIGADLYLAAGGEVVAINGGWDERFRSLSPPLLATLRAIQDGFQRHDRRLDLGLGEQSHKARFADGVDPVGWSVVMLPGRRLPLTAMRTAPMLARHALRGVAKRSLSAEQADRVRAVRARLRR